MTAAAPRFIRPICTRDHAAPGARGCRPGWVYVAEVGAQLKIGCTERGLHDRANRLVGEFRKSVHLLVGLRVACALGAEAYLRECYQHRHTTREFFALTPDDIREIGDLRFFNGVPVRREL